MRRGPEEEGQGEGQEVEAGARRRGGRLLTDGTLTWKDPPVLSGGMSFCAFMEEIAHDLGSN